MKTRFGILAGSISLAILPLTAGAADCLAPQAGLAGWWPGEGNANDIAGANNGALQGGAAANTTGEVGRAFNFDGTNNFVQVADSPSLRPTNLTIEAWVRFSSMDSAGSGGSPPGDQYIVFRQNTRSGDFEGFDLSKTRVGGANVFRFLVSSATAQLAEIHSATLLATGVWYHVAAVRGSNFTQIYVNGQMERQTNVSFAQNYGSLPLYFGTSGQSYWDHKLKGTLDEVSLYNRALSSNEIAAVYAAGSAGKCRTANGPAITSQPQSQTVVAGANASFSAGISGTPPLSYQWRRNGADLTDGGNVSGATSSRLSLANAQLSDSAGFQVVVTNSVGAVTTAVATLTVNSAPTAPGIVTPPASQTVTAGSNATFTVTASGTAPLNFQWRKNGANLADGGQISGVTSMDLFISGAQTNNAGGYSVVVANGAGSVTSAVAFLAVTLPGSCLPPAPGLIGWWPAEGDASDIIGSAGGSLQGGASANAAGMVGRAFSFDGTNSYVQIPDSPILKPTNLTIEAWVRFNSLDSAGSGGSPAGDQYIVFKQNTRSGDFEGIDLGKTRAQGGDVFQFLVTSASAQTASIQSLTRVTTGVWYHVAAVRGGSFSQLFVNGQLEAQTNVSFPQNYGALPLYFGTSGQSYWDHKLKGSLDEVSLYNRALSASEISALYAAGAAGKCKTASPPGITSQPSSQYVAAGSSVTLSVTAAGTAPLGYQWRKDSVNLNDGGNISGASAALLNLVNVQTNNAGSYQVVVTNVAGSTTSAVASLVVSVPGPAGKSRADAVVLVNSHSARYSDFQQRVQPYLDNFGVPYTVRDISVTAPGQSISNYALIIIGHGQLDISQTWLNGAAQANISIAVSSGAGLVNFDNNLASGGTPRYQFIQDIFGFNYGSAASGSSVSLPATEPSSQMHYVTSRHAVNHSIGFRSSLSMPGIVSAGATTLATVAGQPLVAIKKYGLGRALQWGSTDWMISTVLGPVDGLDDVVWRGIVWSARKPFVMRGMPNFVTMRIDDVEGPFWWVQMANDAGFKPFLTFFMSSMSEANTADLRTMINNGKVTASIHSLSSSTMFYFNHQTESSYSDSAQSNNFYVGTQWLNSHGITQSKICATHYSEIGPNAFAGLKAWGMEYVPIEIVPGTVEYASPGAPWLVGGPYRLYEAPQQGQVNWPTYYADWLNVPGHPELNGQFFNIYSEVRDASTTCGEWCPNNDVAGSISRASLMAKRTLDSMVMTTIFSHEWYIHPTSCCGSTTISTSNWRAILQGITNNLAPYSPSYVTLDYASQYVRATRTSRLVATGYDPASGQVSASFSGKTDLDTFVHVFNGQDSSITDSLGPVPVFSASITAIVATVTGSLAPQDLPAARLLAPSAQNGQISFQLEGQAGRTYTIEASSNMESWTETARVTLNSQGYTFTQPVDGIRRFFRAKLMP